MARKWIREIVGNYMVKLAEQDASVVAVSADLFHSCRMEKFMELYPDRIYNTGIAEQNMVGFSAGLCHEGFTPYAFSMAAFLSMRACEQCRTDIAYAKLKARLIGVYAGISGGLAGATHWSIEDCGIMCAIPNMTVLEPSDAIQAEQMLQTTLDYDGPVYMRVSVVPMEDIYDSEYEYELGKASLVRDGNDGCIIACGVIVQYAVQAAEEIRKESGKKIRVVDMHTIKPVDRKAVIDAACTGNIIVAQDHNIIGGLGSAIATVIAEENLNTKFEIAGVNDVFVSMARPEYLYNKFGLDTAGLKKRFYRMIGYMEENRNSTGGGITRQL